MIRFLIAAACILTYSTVRAQNSGELEKRYGFKDIRLESYADSVKGVKFKKELQEGDVYPAKAYTVEHADHAKIGDVKVKEINLKAYNDLIYEISVIVEKDVRLMKALESLFFFFLFDMKNETYFWKTENIILKFRPAGKNSLELLYTSFPMHKLMKEGKQKKVEEIANDF